MTARHHIVRGRMTAAAFWKIFTGFSLYPFLSALGASHPAFPGQEMRAFSGILLFLLHGLALLSLYLPSCRKWLWAELEEAEEPRP